MPVSLLSGVQDLRLALAAFDPGIYSGADCAVLAEELAATEKACASARLLAAARAVDTGEHVQRGFTDGASWLARQSGTTGGQARKALDTARRLEEHPDTRQAMLGGEISIDQAREITETPGCEKELLETARNGDLSQVREHARVHRQTHNGPEELRERQLKLREFRHWQDREGMVRFAGALPPETGLPFVRRVEREALRLRRAVQQAAGHVERFDAYAADAVARLVLSEGSPRQGRPEVDLVIVCDINAWRRGHAVAGEVCQIIGGGPIPVDVARELSRDAFLKAVLHDGTNIHTVTHFGRHVRAVLRTALDLGPAPDFQGRRCVDCGRHFGLERDHVDPVAHNGPTAYDNLSDRCWTCHKVRTERDRRAGLLGPVRAPPRKTG